MVTRSRVRLALICAVLVAACCIPAELASADIVPLSGLELREHRNSSYWHSLIDMQYSKAPDGSLQIYSTSTSRGAGHAMITADRAWLDGKNIDLTYSMSVTVAHGPSYFSIADGAWHRTLDSLPPIADDAGWTFILPNLVLPVTGGALNTVSTGALDLSGATEDTVTLDWFVWDGGIAAITLRLYEILITTPGGDTLMSYDLTDAGDLLVMENTGTTYDYGTFGDPLQPIGIPEPTTLALLGIGLSGLVAWRRRRRSA